MAIHDKHSPRVLVCEALHEDGIGLLETALDVDVCLGLKPAELSALLPGYDGLIERRETQLTAELLEFAFRLKIIGRAMPGLDVFSGAKTLRRITHSCNILWCSPPRALPDIRKTRPGAGPLRWPRSSSTSLPPTKPSRCSRCESSRRTTSFLMNSSTLNDLKFVEIRNYIVIILYNIRPFA